MNGSGQVLRNECEGLTVQRFKEEAKLLMKNFR